MALTPIEDLIKQQQRERAEQERAMREAALDMVVNSDPPKAARVQNMQKETGVRVEDEAMLADLELAAEKKRQSEANERARTKHRVMSTVPQVSFLGPQPIGLTNLSGMALDRWIKDPENAEVTSVPDLEKMRDLEVGSAHLGVVDKAKLAFAYYATTLGTRDFSMSTRGMGINLLIGTTRVMGDARSFLENMVETFVSPDEFKGDQMIALLDDGLGLEEALERRTNDIFEERVGGNQELGTAMGQVHQTFSRDDAAEQARREMIAAGEDRDYPGILFAMNLSNPESDLGKVEEQRKRDEAAAARAEFQISYLNAKADKIARGFAALTGMDRDVALAAVLGVRGEDETKDPSGTAPGLVTQALAETEADVLVNSSYNPLIPISENLLNPQSLIAKGALQAPNTLGGMAAAGAGFAVGGPAGASIAGSAFFIPQAIGQEAENYRNLRDENGDLLPVQYRTMAANVTGTLVGLFEGELNAMGFKVLGLEKVIGSVVRKELTTALGSTGKNWLKTSLGVVAKGGGQSAIEGFEEFEQTLVSAIAEEITKRIAIEQYGAEFDTRTTAADWAPVIEEAVEAAKEGFLASIAFGMSAGSSAVAQHHADVQRSENLYRELIVLVAQVKDMDIRTLSPERLQTFLTEALPADKKNVYIDIDEWGEVWSKVEGATDARSIWKQVFGDTKAYDEAARSKRQRAARVDTPTALRAASELGPTVMFDVVAVMKREADGPSPRKAMKYAQEIRDETNAEVKRLLKVREGTEDGNVEDGLDPEELAYYLNIKEQMTSAEQSLAENAENPERARQQAEDEALFFLAYTKTNAKRLGLPLREVMGMTVAEAGGRPHELTGKKGEAEGGPSFVEEGFVPAGWVGELVTTSSVGTQDLTAGIKGQSATIRISKGGSVKVVAGQEYLNYVQGRGGQVRVKIEYEDGAEFDHRFQVEQRDRAIPSTAPTLQQGEETNHKPNLSAIRAIKTSMEVSGALQGKKFEIFDDVDPGSNRDHDVLFAASALSAASSWGEFRSRIMAISNALTDDGVAMLHLPTIADGQRAKGSRSGYAVTEKQMKAILGMFFHNVIVFDRDATGATYTVRRPRRGVSGTSTSPWRRFYDEEVLRVEDEVGAVLGGDTTSYAAAEAAYYLLGGQDMGWEIFSVEAPGQGTRWFVKEKETNTVVDPYRHHGPIEYGTEEDTAWPGKKQGVKSTMSAGARKVISRVEMLRSDPNAAVRSINQVMEASFEKAGGSLAGSRLVERFSDPNEIRGSRTPLNEPGWAIITAKTQGMTAEQEAAANKELRKELNRPGWHVKETVGKYLGDTENGFLVIGVNREQVLALQRKYKQEASLTHEGLMYSDGTIQQKKGITFKPDTATTDYTEIKLDGASVKFAFEFDWEENRRPIMLELTHMSKTAGLTRLDPAKQGTGLGGREFSNRQRNVGELFVERMNFDITGARQEPRVAKLPYRYTAQIPEGRVYDASTDFDGILAGIREQYPDEGNAEHFSRLEMAIRDSGDYDALRVSDGPRPGHVIVFGEVDVQDATAPALGPAEADVSKTPSKEGLIRSNRRAQRNVVVSSQNFWRWFQKSKGIDPVHGRPMIFFHGTSSRWSTPTTIGPGHGELGFHVSADPGVGVYFAAHGSMPFEPAHRPYTIQGVWDAAYDGSYDFGQNGSVPVVLPENDPWGNHNPEARVYAGYVSVQNPLRLRDMGGWSDDNVLAQMIKLGVLTEEQVDEYSDLTSDELAERLAESGYSISDMGGHWDYMYGRAFLAIVEAGYDSISYINRKEVMGGFDAKKQRRDKIDPRGKRITDGIRSANPNIYLRNLFESLQEDEFIWTGDDDAVAALSILFARDGNLDLRDEYRYMDPEDLDIDELLVRLRGIDEFAMHSTEFQEALSDAQFESVYGGSETFILFKQEQFKSIDNNGDFDLDIANMLEADVEFAANHQRQALIQKKRNAKRVESGLKRVLVGEDGKKVKLVDAIDAAIKNAVAVAEKIKDTEKRKVALGRIPSQQEVISAYAKHILRHHNSEGWRQDTLNPKAPFKMGPKYSDPKSRGRGWKLNFKKGAYQLNQAQPGKSLKFRSDKWKKHVERVALRATAEVRGIFDRYNDAMSTPEASRTPEQVAAIEQVEQLQWYNESREKLRRTFGGLADLFIDILAATSPQQPVALNWKQALEALQIATEGGFDDVIEDVNRWAFLHDKRKRAVLEYVAQEKSDGRTMKSIQADPEYKRLLGEYNAVKDYGTASEDKKGLIAESGEKPFKAPVKRNEMNFSLNNRLVALALADLFRITIAKDRDSGTSASSPKTKRFGTNLSGISEHATVDLWAARFLRRMMNDVYSNKFPRIAPAAEPGVTGDVEGGQTYFLSGREEISDDTNKEFGAGQDIFTRMSEMLAETGDPQLQGITPQMLQAMVWFREKEIWSGMGWTPYDGGSIAEQMDNESLRRYMVNLERGGDLNPEDLTSIASAARAGGAVQSVKTVPSLSPYSHEGALDTEVVAGPDYDPSALALELVRVANERNLPTVHLHRVVDKPTKNSRPMLEVWFNTPQDAKQAVSLIQRALRGSSLRVEFVNKMTGNEAIPGMRVMWIPELEANPRAILGMSDVRVKQMQKLMEGRMADAVETIVNEYGPEQINSVVPSDVEVRVVHAMEYDDVLQRGSVQEAGKSIWDGTGVHESSARALKARGEVGDLQSEALFDDRNQTDWMTSVSVPRAMRTGEAPGTGADPTAVQPAVDAETATKLAAGEFARVGRAIGVHASFQYQENPGRLRDMRITGLTVPGPSAIAALLGVYSQDTIEVSRVFAIKNVPGGQAIQNERAVTNRMPGYVTGELPSIIANIRAEQDFIAEQGLEDTDEFIMMHNHPGGWPNPSKGDVGATFHASLFWNIRRFSNWAVRNMKPGDIRELKRDPHAARSRAFQTANGTWIAPAVLRSILHLTSNFKTIELTSTNKASLDLGIIYSEPVSSRAQRYLTTADIDSIKQYIESLGGPDSEYGLPLFGSHVVIDHRTAGLVVIDPITQHPTTFGPAQTFESLTGAEQDPAVRQILEDTPHIDMTIGRPTRSELEDQIDERIDGGEMFDSTQMPPEWRNPDIAVHEEEREQGLHDPATPDGVLGNQVGGFEALQGRGTRAGRNQMTANVSGTNAAMKQLMEWRQKQLRKELVPIMGIMASGQVTAVATIDTTVHDPQTGLDDLIKEIVEFREKTGSLSLYIGVDQDTKKNIDVYSLASNGAIAGWVEFDTTQPSRNPTVSGYETADVHHSPQPAGGYPYAEGRADHHQDGGRAFAAGSRLYQAAEKDKKRGYYDPVTKKIKFLTAANPSTMIHELGHSFLSMLMQVSSRPDVNAIADEDRNVVMEFLGIDDWSEIGREEQEKFALAFERYMAEGNSPTVEMREAFARASAWMLSTYGNLESVGVEINDEIREFFARLLASKEQINEARREYRIEVAQELSALAEQGEWEEYERVARKAGQRGADDVRLEALKEARRETESWFRDTKDRIRAEVMDEMMREPVWAVLAFLQSGEVPLHIDLPKSFYDENGRTLKLSREDLIMFYGEERVKGLPKPYVYSKSSNSLDPGDVAVVFGFNSDDEMISAIEANGQMGFKREVTRRVDAIIAEKYGDMMRNRQQLLEKAADSIHNDDAFDMLVIESELLAKKLGKSPGVGRREATKALKAEAEREVSKERIADLKPHKYLQLEQRLAREFRKLLNEGKLAEAHKVQERRVWAHALYRASKDAKQRAESTRKLIRRNTTTKALLRIGKAGEQYVDAVLALASLYSTDQISDKQLRRIEKLRVAIERIEKDEQDLTFGEEVIDKARGKSYKEATVGEYDELRSNFDNILRLARLKSRMKSRRRQMELDDVAGLMLSEAEANVPEGKLYDPDRHNKKTKDRIAESAKRLNAELVRLEPIIDLLDGGKIDGPWREFFWDLFVQAQHQEAMLLEQYADVIESVYKRLTKEQRHALYSKTVHIKSTGRSWTRQALIVVALNMGTESNYERLLNKQKNTKWDEGVIQEMIGELTAEEWDFVQAIWDEIQSLWPMIEDLEARLTGNRPKPIARREFEVRTSDGKVRKIKGGYYPLVYGGQGRAPRLQDPNRPLSAHDYIRAQTPHPHTKERMQKVKDPILLDLDVFPGHIMSVIHDLTHREAIIQAQRILAHEDVRFAIEDRLGTPYLKVFDEMIRRVARDNNQRMNFDGMMKKIRSNATVMTMGLKATVAVQNFANFGNVMEPGVGVRPDYLARGMTEWTANPVGTHEFIKQNSPELAHRFNTFDRDVSQLTKTMTGRKTFKAYMTRAAFAGIAITDMLVAETAWIGKYRQSLAAGNSHDQAVMEADRMVTLTLGAGGTKDLSLIQANPNEMTKWFTMYYSWFANAYSRFWSLYRGADNAWDEGGFWGLMRFMPYAFLRSFSFWIFPAMFAEWLANRGPEDGDDDDEKVGAGEWLTWGFAKTAMYPLYTVPGLRELAGGAEATIMGEPARPRAGLFADLMNKTGMIMNKTTSAFDDDEEFLDILEELADSKSYTSGLIDLVFGIGLGIPTKQPKITLGYWKDVIEGDREPENVWEFLRDSTFYSREDD